MPAPGRRPPDPVACPCRVDHEGGRPAATTAGIDPVHFGAISLLNIAIGMISPPFGINIFKAIATFNASFGEIFGTLRPFIVIALVARALLTCSKALVMWLPGPLAG
ncbi:TRAP transporter large permease subunit [Pseudooceanicola sp. C21-150M6]|uniref:TRAP transporter large permease subunit n=1 Tax=Pseudooceanicola sp. C21-150M6 TaxID=3434355 RepID=UPI003D7F6A51